MRMDLVTSPATASRPMFGTKLAKARTQGYVTDEGKVMVAWEADELFDYLNEGRWAQAATWLWWIGGVALPKQCLNPEPIEPLTKPTTFEPGSVNWTLLVQQTAANIFGLLFAVSVFCHVFQGRSSCDGTSLSLEYPWVEQPQTMLCG